MAKDDIDLDDINFDSDDWDLNFDVKPPKDDRNPVKKIASGTIKGMKSTLKDPQFLKRKLLQTLPPGYSKASSLLEDAGSELSDLYNIAAKELEPMRKMGISATKAALPKLKGKLPKKIEQKLQDILDDAERNKTSFSVNQDEANMALELGEIFKTQMEHQEQLREKEEVTERTKTAINFKQHKESLSELATVRQGIDKLVGYQDSINFKFQKKSLELQFKQYYAQRDLLELTKTTNKTVIESLASITKNTALPEFVKVQTTETGKQMLRERMLKSLGGTVSEFAPNYMKNFSKNIKDRVKMELSALGAMASMGDMISLDDMREMGIDPLEELAGGTLGSGATNFLTDSLIYRYKDKLPYMKKINKMGNKLSIFSNEMPTMLDEFAKSGTRQTGIKGDALRFIKSMMPRFNMKTALETDSIKTIDQATHFDSQTRKSIVEIIPGYLARILRSIDIMRTGDENTDLVSYDLMSNSFVGRNELKKTLASRMFSKTNLERAGLDTSYVLQHLDPEDKLAPDLKKLLKSQMLSDAQQNKRISVERYLKEDTYGSFVDPASRAKIISFFQEISGKGDEDKSFAEELSRRAGYLRNSIPNSREMAQTFINAGYGDILRESGIVGKMGDVDNLDFNKVLQAYREGPEFLYGNQPTPSGGRRRRVGKRPATPQQERIEPAQTYRDEVRYQAVAQADPEIKSFLDLFKSELFNNLLESRKLDEERNIKLDEMILRMEGFGVDGRITGPGTRSFKERSKSLSKRMKGAGGRLYDKAKGLTSKWLDFNKGVIGSAFGAAKQTVLGVKDVLFNKVQDVYTSTDLKTPKLRADLMRAGKYRDEVTGKVIRSFNDIKGRVIDENGNIVLDLPDIQAGLVNKSGEKIRGFISRFMGASLEMLGKVGGGMSSVTGELLKLPGNVLRGINKLFGKISTTETDLYLPGEKHPRLTLAKLRAGDYYDGETLEVLTSFKNLKNGVRDVDGNYVLTPQEASRGMININGISILKPFKTIASMAGSLVGGIVKLNMKLVGGAGRLIGKGMSKLKNAVTREDKQILLLTEIRDILDDRLADGTIDRAGSAEDILSKRKGKGKKDALNPLGSKDKKGKKDKEEGGGLFSAIGNLGDAVQGLTAMMGWMGKLLKLPFKAAGLLGRGAMALGGLATSGIGSIAAGAAAGTGVGGTLMAIGAGATSMAGAALTGIASILSAPVVLGAAAVAAVAYGGYKLYKYLKSKNAWLGKIRMAQYGVDPVDSDKVSMIGDLEGLLIKKVKASAAGYEITLDEDTVEEIFDIFDVDPDDKQQSKFLIEWFDKRFKPVFLAHVKAADRFAKGSSLMEVDDKVPLSSKLEYIKMVSFGEGGPYSIASSPFDGDYTLPTGSQFPKQFIDQATAYYKKEMEKEGGGTAKAAGAAAGAIVAKAATDANGQPIKGATAKTETSTFSSLMNKALPVAAMAAKVTMFGIPAAVGMSLGGKILDFFLGKSEGLDAFTSVRVKAYGLKELNNAEQIKTLLLLESYVTRKARLNKDGSVTAPINEQQLLSEFASKFGVDTNSASDLERFFVWFKSRFLPVCLKYFSLVRTMEPMLSMDKVADKLKPSQKASIAKELVAVNVSPETNASIWTISISPFSDTEMNTDKSSCNGHIKYLESMTTENEVKTQDMAVKKTPGQTTSSTSKSLFSSLADKASSIWAGAKEGAKEGANNLLSKGKDIYQKAVDATSRGMEKAADVGQSLSRKAGQAGAALGASYAYMGTGNREIDSSGGGVISRGKYRVKVPEGIGKGVPIGFRLVNDLMAELGLTLPQAAAVAGNLGHECVDFEVMQERKPLIPGSKGGYGFCQWTGPRRRNFEAYCKANNLDTDSYEANFGFLKYEITQTPEGKGFANVKTAETVEDATFNVMADFLRPSPAHAGYDSRLKRARAYMKHFSGDQVAQAVKLDEKGKEEKAAENKPAVSSTVPALLSPTSAIAAKPQPQQTAVAGLMNMNPLDVSGMTKPSAEAVATKTDAVNRTIDAVTDKQNYQTNVSQDYQTVSMEAQRKASSEYLNGGIDKMGGVLGEQLNVQKSIDNNIKQLVQLIKSGNLSQAMQGPQTTPVSGQGGQSQPTFDRAKTVKGPVSMRRTNV